MLVIIAAVLLLSTAAELTSGACTKEHVLLTGSKGQLASPDKGESGACTWIITVPKDQRIIFYFESYNIYSTMDGYPEPRCGDTVTRIELKDSSNYPPWKTYCQSDMPQPIATNKSSLIVNFTFSKSDSKSWFTAEYTTLPFKEDVDLQESSSAEISSPMFPGKYPRNSYFKWSVVAPSGFRIKIEFTKLDIHGEYYYQCPTDAVVVRDGPSDQSEVLYRICGDDTRRVRSGIYTSGNSMTLEFVSEVQEPNRNSDNFGFKATVSKEAKLYLILLPCGIGILLVSSIVGAVVMMCRRRSSSGAGNPRMQMSLLNDDDRISATQMSDIEPPHDANLPVYRPTTQAIQT